MSFIVTNGSLCMHWKDIQSAVGDYVLVITKALRAGQDISKWRIKFQGDDPVLPTEADEWWRRKIPPALRDREVFELRRQRENTRTFSLYEALPIAEGYEYPYKAGDRVLMLGEVAQMPGHCVIALQDGRVLFGYHTENFRRLTEDEA